MSSRQGKGGLKISLLRTAAMEDSRGTQQEREGKVKP